MLATVLAVADLPVVEYGHEQISYDELVQLIGVDAAADLLCRSRRDLAWIVDRYMLAGLWLWVDISWEGGELPVIRHYYGV